MGLHCVAVHSVLEDRIEVLLIPAANDVSDSMSEFPLSQTPMAAERIRIRTDRAPRGSVLETLERKPRQGSGTRLGGSVTVSMIIHAAILLVLGVITHVVGLPSPMIVIQSGMEGWDDSSLHSPEILLAGDQNESLPGPTESPVSLLPKIPSPTVFEALSSQRASGSRTDGGGGGGAGGTGKGGFFGVPLNEKSIVFVLDRSGSMRGDRIQRVHYELQSAINGLAPDQKFNVLVYNSDVSHALPSSRMLLPATSTNRRLAVKATRDYSATGGTNGALAIREALKLKPEAIVFLTDGEFDIDIEVDVFEENKQGTTIHTVSIGDGTSLDVLRKIAGGSQGRFQHVYVEKQKSQHQNSTAAIRSRDAQRLLRMAAGLERRRKFDKAREYCQKLIQEYSKHAEAEIAKEILARIDETESDQLLNHLKSR